MTGFLAQLAAISINGNMEMNVVKNANAEKEGRAILLPDANVLLATTRPVD